MIEENIFAEEDEGLDDTLEGSAPSQDPDEYFHNNAFRIVYQTNNFFLPQIKEMIDRGEAINLRPEYQRRLNWSNKQKSLLIESLLLNIPVPPVFFYESDAARYEVMDGQQRLNAIKSYFAGDFALSGLTILAPLNGIRYSKCPPRIKRALERASISVIVLLLESSENANGKLALHDIRRFVFDRLNTGGKKLNAQEIRNALNPGPLNNSIIEITRQSIFTSTFGIPPYTESDPNEFYENPKRQQNSLYKTMKDCELVLRFVALRDNSNIRGSMKSMLDRAMKYDITEVEASQLTIDFNDRLQALHNIFGKDVFLLPEDQNGKRRLSQALYDSSMVAMDRRWGQIVIDDNEIRNRLEEAFNDEESLDLLTGKANTAEAVRSRISLMEQIFTSE